LIKIKEILTSETADNTDYRLMSNMIGMYDDFDNVLFMLKKLSQGVLESTTSQ